MSIVAMYYSELTCLIKTRMLFDIKCCSISDFPNVFLRILKLFISHKSHSQVSKFSNVCHGSHTGSKFSLMFHIISNILEKNVMPIVTMYYSQFTFLINVGLI